MSFVQVSGEAGGWVNRAWKNSKALAKMAASAALAFGAIFSAPFAVGNGPLLLVLGAATVVGVIGYLLAATHFKPRYTMAGGSARWGSIRDESVKALLLPSSHKPNSLSRSRRNIYWGLLGKAPVFYSGVKHGVLTGPPRCGKDSGIFTQNLLHLDDWSIVVVDPKGEQAAATARHRAKCGQVIIFNPFGMHGIRSDGFNPLVMPSFIENMFEWGVSLVRSLVEIGETREVIFPAGGQELLLALILYTCLEAKKVGGIPSLAVVNSHLRLPFEGEGNTLMGLMQQLTTHEHGELQRLAGSFTTDDRIIQSFVASAKIPLTFLNNEILLSDLSRHPMVNGKPWDFRDLKEKVGTVYIILPDDKLRKYDFWLRMVVACALEALNAGLPGKVRQLIMVNEAGNLGRLDALESAMVMGAEKLTVLTAWQHLDQIRKLYGEGGLKSFLVGAGFFGSFGAAGDEFTAGYISRRAGTRTVAEKRFRLGEETPKAESEGGVSYPLIHPSDVMSLSDRQLIAWIDPAQKYPLMLHAPRSQRGDPNPYYAKS